MNDRLIPSKNTKSDPQLPDNGSQSTTQNLSTPTSNREFAWQVAANLLISFKYAWAGVSYSFQTQRNFRIHVVIGALVIGLSVFLHLKSVEIAVIGITIGLVLAMELINTAIESVVDLTVKQSYHELAKIAKDCAAAAVLVSASGAVLVAGALLLPPLFALIHQLGINIVLGVLTRT